ncbi:unnamed protein product (mitochondrion) [Plasmodiophora brassicae]|uniref:Inner centromere protein ARK-binding domain-containing protein n=1 Tax=Plasmodiophora brassicae TaxID=37360 RepID=A0A3P3Y1S1_PLABS|nr:unnamed protein product [Plasmodiophora brassicae]
MQEKAVAWSLHRIVSEAHALAERAVDDGARRLANHSAALAVTISRAADAIHQLKNNPVPLSSAAEMDAAPPANDHETPALDHVESRLSRFPDNVGSNDIAIETATSNSIGTDDGLALGARPDEPATPTQRSTDDAASPAGDSVHVTASAKLVAEDSQPAVLAREVAADAIEQPIEARESIVDDADHAAEAQEQSENDAGMAECNPASSTAPVALFSPPARRTRSRRKADTAVELPPATKRSKPEARTKSKRKTTRRESDEVNSKPPEPTAMPALDDGSDDIIPAQVMNMQPQMKPVVLRPRKCKSWMIIRLKKLPSSKIRLPLDHGDAVESTRSNKRLKQSRQVSQDLLQPSSSNHRETAPVVRVREEAVQESLQQSIVSSSSAQVQPFRHRFVPPVEPSAEVTAVNDERREAPSTATPISPRTDAVPVSKKRVSTEERYTLDSGPSGAHSGRGGSEGTAVAAASKTSSAANVVSRHSFATPSHDSIDRPAPRATPAQFAKSSPPKSSVLQSLLRQARSGAKSGLWESLYSNFTNISTAVSSFVKPKEPEKPTKRAVEVKALKSAALKKRKDEQREEELRERNRKYHEAGELRKRKAEQAKAIRENEVKKREALQQELPAVEPVRANAPEANQEVRLIELSTEERLKRAEERRQALIEEEKRKRAQEKEERQRQRELFQRRRDEELAKKQQTKKAASAAVSVPTSKDALKASSSSSSVATGASKQAAAPPRSAHKFAVPAVPPSPEPVVEIPINAPPSDSDEDDEDSDREQQKKRIPKWAQPAALLSSLAEQARIDPDTIFPPDSLKSCNLEEVFVDFSSKTRFTRRTSSGNWVRDRLGWKEELDYKRRNGYL